jgi:hypothetical protein
MIDSYNGYGEYLHDKVPESRNGYESRTETTALTKGGRGPKLYL